MSSIIVENNEEFIMRLVHYFIIEEHYTPIVVNGVNNEIWLENISSDIGIIRINSNYIHNNEQLKLDVLRTKSVIKQIKKKTVSFKLNSLNIHLNLNEGVSTFNDEVITMAKVKSLVDLETNKFISSFFPNINSKLIKDKNGIDLIMNVTKDINKKTEKNNKTYQNIFKKKKIIVTPIIIAICIVMFLISLFMGALVDYYKLIDLGALFGPLVVQGEVFRLITSAFLHADVLHILLNMYALFIIGSQIETYFGKIKYILIFVISAISGSLLSVALNDGISVGASGAIFGLLGALAYFGYYHRVYLGSVLTSQILPLIGLNILIGFMVPGIDQAGHIGGLVGGLLTAMSLGLGSVDHKNNRIHGKIVLLLYFVFLIYFIFFIKY